VQATEPVYSVLLLILVFLVTAFTLLLLSVEFLAYVYVIVYVGAVSLLFIFVLFTLGPVYSKAYRRDSSWLFRVLGIKFVALFGFALWDFIYFPFWEMYRQRLPGFLSNAIYTNDITIFSRLLYTEHFFLLWVVAVILLVAMIGPIIFHFNHKQSISFSSLPGVVFCLDKKCYRVLSISAQAWLQFRSQELELGSVLFLEH
jgi:NADH-ubiquinone oxidoreductase chain 6